MRFLTSEAVIALSNCVVIGSACVGGVWLAKRARAKPSKTRIKHLTVVVPPGEPPDPQALAAWLHRVTGPDTVTTTCGNKVNVTTRESDAVG